MKSRYWAKHRPSSTEDDSDDEIASYSTKSIRYKAEYERQRTIIKQLKLENEAAKNRIKQLENKFETLSLMFLWINTSLIVIDYQDNELKHHCVKITSLFK